MQLTPRYEGPPVLRLEVTLGDVSVPLLRQRRRLADALAALDDRRWADPSRCAGWSVHDVLAHLTTTNEFWTYSITAGLDGTPTQFLRTFDPVSTPPQLLAPFDGLPPRDILARFVASNEALADVLAGLDEAGWGRLAESPPGHVEIRLVALHALWDGWIHERDVLLPLGVEPAVEPDEVFASLLYVSALGPALLANAGSTREAVLVVEATEPEVRFTIEAGRTVVLHDHAPPAADAVRLTGGAVGLLEALSYRAPAPDIPAEDRWLFGGLGDAFDVRA